MPMHPLLPEFYRLVDIEPQADTLAQRAQALDTMVDELTLTDCVDVVRIFLQRPVDATARSRFAERFRAVDPVFPIRNNDAELSALAGQLLYQVMEQGQDVANASAYALITVDAFGHGVRGPIPDVLQRAHRYIHEEALAARRDPVATGDSPGTRLKVPPNPFAGMKEIAVTAVPADWAQVDTQIRATRTQLNAVMAAAKSLHTGLAKTINQLVDALARAAEPTSSRAFAALREETDILWWLFGERSMSLDIGFGELPAAGAALVIASELAELTRLLPGPVATRGLLARGLRLARRPEGEQETVANAVSALPRTWRENFSAKLALPTVSDLIPLHAAVAATIEVAEGDGWTTRYDYASVVPSTTRFGSLDLASQFYYEALLVRAVAETQG